MRIFIRSLFLLIACGLSLSAFGQTASILPPGKTTFFDINGNPLSSGTVTFYTPGTTTLKTTWQDSNQKTKNTNPVVLDSAGRGLIYGSGSYRQVLKDKAGNTIWDALTSSTGTGGSSTPQTGDGNLVATVLAWAGLVAPNQYVFAYGQEISRTTYATFMTAITLTGNATCTSGSPILTNLADTTQIPVGGAIEILCLAPGTTVLSKTTTTITVTTNGTVTTTAAFVIFPWGNGDGSTTFNVPDYRGRVVAGRDNMGGSAASRLTATYFGETASAIGANGGSETKVLIASNLPAYTPSGTVAISDPGHTHTVNTVISASNVLQGGSSYTLTSTNSGNSKTGVTAAFTGAAQGGTSTAFATIQPTITVNYIIKITPDTNSSEATGVLSLGGMTGVIACGYGLTCTGNTISVVTDINYWILSGNNVYRPIGFVGVGAIPSYSLDANVIDNANNKIRLVNTTSTGAGQSGSLLAFEVLGVRGDGDLSFGGRVGAAFRRTDGTVIASGTGLGYMAFGGQWGTDQTFQTAKVLYPASIVGIAEGNFTSASAMATGLSFRTGLVGEDIITAGTTYGTERMRITSAGVVAVTSAITASTWNGNTLTTGTGTLTLDTTTALVASAVPRKVATMAALIAIAASDTSTYYLQGYYAAGDGGEGLFVWNSGSSATADNGVVVNPTGNAGAGRRIRATYSTVANVAWWGLRCDWNGTTGTDDQPAYQAAINYLVTVSGGKAIIPRGCRSAIAATIAVQNNNIFIEAEGGPSTRRNGFSTAVDCNVALYWTGSASGTMMTYNPITASGNKLTLVGGGVKGLCFYGRGSAGRGLYARSIISGVWNNLYFESFTNRSMEISVNILVNTGESCDSQFNLLQNLTFNNLVPTAETAGDGLVVAGVADNTRANNGCNFSYNTAININSTTFTGTPIRLNGVDNNKWFNMRATRNAGVYGIVYDYSDIAVGPANVGGAEYWYGVGGSMHVIAGGGIFIYGLDRGNGSPDPVLESGTTASWIDSDLKISHIYQLSFANVLSCTTTLVTSASGVVSCSGTTYMPIAGGTFTGGIGFSTTNTLDIGTNATTLAPRTVYAGTSFVGPIGTFTTSVAAGGATIGSDALGVTGTTTHNGAVVVNAASLSLSGNQSSAAWTTSGIRYKNVAATFTDTTSSGTVAAAYTNVFGGSTIAASSATTFTQYYNTYIKAPIAGSNVTFTNLTALGADSIAIGGAAQGSNALAVTGTVNISGNITQGSASLLLWSTDTNLSRNAAGIVQFGTTVANASGSWLATNGTISGNFIVGGGSAITSTGVGGALGTGAFATIANYAPLAGATFTGPVILSVGTTTNKPLQFQSGTLLTTPVAGTVEFLTDAYYGTITTGAARRTFAFLQGPTFTGTVTIPTSFVLGATTVTTTGTQLNYLASASGTTGTASTNLVFSASPTFTGTTLASILTTSGDITRTSTGNNYIAAKSTTTGSLNITSVIADRGDTANGYASFEHRTAGSTIWSVGIRAGSTDLQWFDEGGTTTRMQLSLAGALYLPSLGADTAQIDATVCRVAASGLLVTGTGALGICLGTSGRQFKNSITSTEDGLDKILQLMPRNFYYNQGHIDNGARLHYGFIADEVFSVLPRLVGMDRNGVPNTVDMFGMTPIMVRAIQQLKAENDNLRAANDNFKMRLERLEARNR